MTSALCELAEQYPTMCEVFLTRLPLRLLGEMEIPNSLAQQVGGRRGRGGDKQMRAWFTRD